MAVRSFSDGPHLDLYGPTPAILLTNDDGVHPELALILPLAQHLLSKGYNVVVCAPGANNSACGQRITLGSPLTMRRHRDYEQRFSQPLDKTNHSNSSTTSPSLRVYSIDEGTPSDCVAGCIEPRYGLLAKLGFWPFLVLSGINYGPNLATDVIYSGTFAGARQAALYGIPAIAVSLNLYYYDDNNTSHIRACRSSIRATVDFSLAMIARLPDMPMDLGRLRPSSALKEGVISRDTDACARDKIFDAFARGDILLNVNYPATWDGEYESTTLDSVIYRDVTILEEVPGENVDGNDSSTLRFGGSKGPEFMFVPGSDACAVLKKGTASVSALSAFPVSHPLMLPAKFFEDVASSGLEDVFEEIKRAKSLSAA